MYCNKKITLVLFVCLLISIISIIGYKLFDIITNIIDNKVYDHFYGKRSNKLKIYKSDEIYDPDETPEYDDDIDPDKNPDKYDPDR